MSANKCLWCHFNSHAHVERDLCCTPHDIGEGNFNSHAHVERDGRYGLLVMDLWNFNSHAHVERDVVRNRNALDFCISTHTLTWSVTCGGQSPRPYQSNFNSHAHVERDPSHATSDTASAVYFNSHAHVERDDTRPY